ncbi:MAG: DNA replication/repair protein RecF [Acholeplasmataceae bacterium]
MIKTIELRNFRNHQSFFLNFEKPFVYLGGKNGSGKTSILESIYFIATTKSHRTSDEKELIKKNEPFSIVKIKTDQYRFEVVLSKNGKRASIDGLEKRRLSDFIGTLKVVMFSAEDLELIKGAPSNRRQFLDLEWMQLNKQYLKRLNQYKNVLKQRNSLLKRLKIEDDWLFLNILGEQLYEIGVELIAERKKFIEMLNEFLKESYISFSNHKVEIIYEPDVDEKQFKKHLSSMQKQDIVYQNTTAGPHRDDFLIKFNGNPAKNYASQGEQRLIVIALKLALLKIIEKETNEKAILLLDDVLSELDLEKQQMFLKHLPKEHQLIMSSALPLDEEHIQYVVLDKEINANVKI